MGTVSAPVRAMIHHRNGQAVAAAQELANAHEQIAKWRSQNGWHDRQLAKVLLREAEALMEGPTPAAGQNELQRADGSFSDVKRDKEANLE